MSRGPGRTQRTVLELLEEAGGSLPVSNLYRDLASAGVNRSNARRAIKGLLERGDVEGAEEARFRGPVRCVRVVARGSSVTDVMNLWWERSGKREYRRQRREEQEGATATPCLVEDPMASGASGEGGAKRQRGTPHVASGTPCSPGPRGEESVSDNILRLLEHPLSLGSPHESEAVGTPESVSDNAIRPGASIAEVLADPEARAFVASPVPMVPKPKVDERGDQS